MKTEVTRTTLWMAGMAGIVAVVAGLAAWDAERESDAALDQFAERGVTLSRALAAVIARPAQVATGPLGQADLLARLRTVERPRALAVLIHRPGQDVLLRDRRGAVRSSPVLEALAAGRRRCGFRATGRPCSGCRRAWRWPASPASRAGGRTRAKETTAGTSW